MEERKRKADEKKRVKRMLEAAFDGEIDEINAILKEASLNLEPTLHVVDGGMPLMPLKPCFY